jgi:hypothetical protein
MNEIDVVFSFDTTGSMYPCLTQVRREVGHTIQQLFHEIKGIRIGIMAHGDYCDQHVSGSYVIKVLDLSSKEREICNFVQSVGKTHGGDFPECYELVLHEARRLAWNASKSKVLVMIGDATPHPPHHDENERNLDWRNELDMLKGMGVHVYGVQCLNRRESTPFWKEVAQRSEGRHLMLHQFSQVTDLVKAVCYKQVSDDRLIQYADLVTTQGRMTRSMADMFGVMLKDRPGETPARTPGRTRAMPTKTFKKAKFDPVDPARFQVLRVDGDTPIKTFVEENALDFNIGRGFYEFTKPELIQERKEVVLMDRDTGDMYTGDLARELLGLPYGQRGTIQPKAIGEYIAFIQSTSANRKLLARTRFLYEVSDYARRAA